MNISGTSGGENSRYSEACFPKLGDDYKYSFDFSGIAVNPNSPNKDIAVAFLAYHCNVLVTRLSSNTRILRLFEDKVEEYGANPVSQVYRTQLANSIHKTSNNDFIMLCFNLKKGIISGEVTPAEAAEEAYRFMKMARDE